MLMADAGITVWIIGLLLVGVLGFVVMVLALVFKFFGWTLHALFGGRRRKPGYLKHDQVGRRLICPRADCGHSNDPRALYCGRCGRPLRRTYDVDAYG